MNADNCERTTAEGNGMGKCVVLTLTVRTCAPAGRGHHFLYRTTAVYGKVWARHVEQNLLVVVDSGKHVVDVPASAWRLSLSWGCVVYSRESLCSGGGELGATVQEKWKSNAVTFCRRLQGCCRCEAAGGRGRGEEGRLARWRCWRCRRSDGFSYVYTHTSVHSRQTKLCVTPQRAQPLATLPSCTQDGFKIPVNK